MATKNSFLKSITPNLTQIILFIVSIAAAFFIGKLTAEVNMYKQGFDPSGNFAGQPAQGAQPTQPEEQPYQPIDPSVFSMPKEDDHVRGDPNAPIAIVEYSDFDCPYCGQFHSTAQQIIEDYDDEVFWVYRHFPLEQLHPDAKNKAIASECIYEQGGDDAFWAFADGIFSSGSGSPLTETQLQGYASDLGLNSSQLISCFNNQETSSIVDAELQEGTTTGVRGTPGNYIVNIETQSIIPLRGAEPYENVVNVLDMVK